LPSRRTRFEAERRRPRRPLRRLQADRHRRRPAALRCMPPRKDRPGEPRPNPGTGPRTTRRHRPSRSPTRPGWIGG